MRSKILCIEDDPTILALVEASLKEFQVISAKSLKEAEIQCRTQTFAAILIDIELPDGDGLRFYSKLVQDPKFKSIPTLMLSSHTDVSNKVLAFSVGADDFISKPFDPVELHARVTSRVKKVSATETQRRSQVLGDIEIDFDRQKAVRHSPEKEIDLGLTGIELKILALLARRLEQVYSREQILTNVWGDTHITDRTVDSHVAHLRTKLAPTSLTIETIKNFGYCLKLRSGQ